MTDENERIEEEVQPEQAAEADDQTEELEQLRADLESANSEIVRLQNERYLLSRGVSEEDLDYYAFKIGQTEGAKDDFKKAARDYLKAHPIRRVTVNSGAELSGSRKSKAQTPSELMNSLLRNHN